jgi:hypothetical protein
MPSLIRFVLVVGVFVGAVYAGMIALVTFVQPEPREMTQTIPPNRLNGK